MGDGWETKRNRTPKNRDWIIVKLAHKGRISSLLVDTCHFKGNYPDSCIVEGLTPTPTQEIRIYDETLYWETILPRTKLQADHKHHFESEIVNNGPFTHVRLSIFPDGGISRLRVFGKIV